MSKIVGKIIGAVALEATLRDLGKKIAGKAVTAGIRAATKTVTKAIQTELPSRLRPAIGSLVKKFRSGYILAKSGASVGKRKPAKSRNGRPGVGISANNIHWYILGTTQRRNKAGANRGRMPAHPAVKAGYAKSESSALAAARTQIQITIERETTKAAAKNRKKG